jgi:molybdopterin synthase catalytic subunit
MIKIQKEDFNVEEEISSIKKIHSNVGAVTSFIGYVRDNNNNTNVESINLEVYEKMAFKQFKKLLKKLTLNGV